MLSIMREKYSISSRFYLYSFLLFLSQPVFSQEILWTHPGVGARPVIQIMAKANSDSTLTVTSPFGNDILKLNALDGKKFWGRTFSERIPHQPLTLTDSVVLEGDQGTIWALDIHDGSILWTLRARDPLDYPAGPLQFVGSSVFAHSRKGVVRKIGNLGEELLRTKIENSWGTRVAQTVPLQSNHNELVYADQSGRITFLNPEDLSLELSMFDSDDETDKPNQELLGLALSSDSEALWTTELSGRINAISLKNQQYQWNRYVASPENLWSTDAALVSIPTPVTLESRPALLVLERYSLSLFDPSNGELLIRRSLPSPAVAPASFDQESSKWWVLCQEHLVAVEPDAGLTSRILPLVEQPFSLEVNGRLAVIGTLNGQLYGVSLSSFFHR